jgi:hypothetical protein
MHVHGPNITAWQASCAFNELAKPHTCRDRSWMLRRRVPHLPTRRGRRRPGRPSSRLRSCAGACTPSALQRKANAEADCVCAGPSGRVALQHWGVSGRAGSCSTRQTVSSVVCVDNQQRCCLTAGSSSMRTRSRRPWSSGWRRLARRRGATCTRSATWRPPAPTGAPRCRLTRQDALILSCARAGIEQ